MRPAQSLGRPIAVGRTAEIYPWADGWIVKLYQPPWAESAEYEARVARAVHAAGLPAPAVGNVVSVKGRAGLVYEHVRGESMLSLMRRKPWTVARYARLLAELHAQIHACNVAGLPSQRDRLADAIGAADGLSAPMQRHFEEVLGRLGRREHLCHGDFHPGNVMMTANGPVVVDWVNATQGDPAADVARTTLLLQLSLLKRSPGSPWLWRLSLSHFCRTYITTYFALAPDARAQLSSWQPIVAAARLSERVPGERAWLLRAVQDRMPDA